MFSNNKSLEGIIAGFNKTLTNLEAFREKSRQDAARKRADAEALTFEAKNHDSEADRADKIHSNILSLLG